MTEVVTKFLMGEAVPEWLITVEPMTPAATKENFRFAIDVDVIETPDVFLVVPRIFGTFNAVIDISGTAGCRMFAPGKVTRVVERTVDFFPEGPGMHLTPLTPPPAVQVVDRVDTHTAPVYVPPEHMLPDPHPTFWSRLRYVFRGR